MFSPEFGMGEEAQGLDNRDWSLLVIIFRARASFELVVGYACFLTARVEESDNELVVCGKPPQGHHFVKAYHGETLLVR